MKRMIAALGVAALAVTGLAAPASAAETKFDLIAGGGNVASSNDIGDVFVTDDGVGPLAVRVVLTGDLNPANPAPTLIHGISAEANCTVNQFPLSKGNPVPGQFDYQQAFPGGTADVIEFTMPRPSCADPLVAVHADVKQAETIGGLAGVELKMQQAVTFKVAYPGASSYFDINFLDGSGFLSGESFAGGCVDVGHYITPGQTYSGTVYSGYNIPEGSQIDKPENMPAVAWLVNNPGTANKGTIQYAIWLLLDFTPTGTGLGEDVAAAQVLADEALLHLDFVPTCGDVVPVILVVPGSQTLIVQTTYALLEVPCESFPASSDTAMAMDTSKEVKEGANLRYGNQFPGSNWFSYVIAL